MSDVKTAPKERTFVYTLGRIASFLVARGFCPVRYHYPERLKEITAPCILISNHKSALDPLVIAYPCPYEIRFLGKRELEGSAFTRWLMNGLHMIPVSRKETDLAAMRACSKALRDGAVLGIFPEGTRHLDSLMETVESGVSLLALRSGVPLRPVYIDGKLRPFHLNHVVVGRELEYDDLKEKGVNAENADLLSHRIRETFFALREEAGRLKKAK